MRCEECGKFVSYDKPTLEISDVQYDDGQIDGEIEVELPCAECGSTLRQGTITFKGTFSCECESTNMEIDEYEVEPTEVKHELGKGGRKLKNPTYSPAAFITIRLKCLDCEQEHTAYITQEYENSEIDEY